MPAIRPKKQTKPQWFLIKAVSLTVLLGTLCLMLPCSVHAVSSREPLIALFTATSSVCITGHTLVSLAEHYTFLGQIFILILIQIGGLGFMLLGTLLLSLAGRHIKMGDEQALMDVLHLDETAYLKKLLRHSVWFSLLCESLGAFLLVCRYYFKYEQPFSTAAFNGIFHAVSAYCNAGLSLFPDSLAGYKEDPVILVILGVMVLLGGLGFIVIYDLSHSKLFLRSRRKQHFLRIHTKIVLWMTLVLSLGGALIFALLEWKQSLAGLSVSHKLVNAFFQTIVLRTGGFNLTPAAQAHPATRLSSMILMFIGGAPGSTAGGIKVTTVFVLLLAAFSMIRNRREVVIFKRTVPERNVIRALVVFILSVFFIVLTYGCLLLFEYRSIATAAFSTEFLLFDTISAFSTVGLSCGVLPLLSQPGVLIIIACMFIGRVGPLTIALLLANKQTRQLVHHPEEEVWVG